MGRGLTAVLVALLTVGLAACGSDAAGQAGQGERSGQETPKTFASDRELVGEFLKDIQSDKDAKNLPVRLSNASLTLP